MQIPHIFTDRIVGNVLFSSGQKIFIFLMFLSVIHIAVVYDIFVS